MDFKYTLDSYSESSDVRGSQNTARIRRTESARKIHIGKVVWLYDWPPPRVTKKISLSYVLNNGKQLKAPINHAKVFIVILIINMNPKHSMYGLFTLYLHLGSWGGKCRLVLWASNIYIYILHSQFLTNATSATQSGISPWCRRNFSASTGNQVQRGKPCKITEEQWKEATAT